MVSIHKMFLDMHSVGFEPTLPKKLRPERSALDHSAKSAWLILKILMCYPPTVGIEPTTIGLKGQRSTVWAKWAFDDL